MIQVTMPNFSISFYIVLLRAIGVAVRSMKSNAMA